MNGVVADVASRSRPHVVEAVDHGVDTLSTPKYRADIDGLRAIAVSSVVAFHGFPGWLAGGFVGVDVFFVISGYLISTIILTNLEAKRFSFATFYARRIRRIFPALLVVLVTTLFLGWLFLLPDEYWELAKQAAASASFVVNYVFYDESGYFDALSLTKPLLHLWSLGIEEQFYIFWPLLVWCAWKQRLDFLYVAAAIVLLSFALNIKDYRSDTGAAFYLISGRAWELSLGSILAAFPFSGNVAQYDRIQQTGRNLFSVAGIGMICLSALLFSRATAYPGWAALVPTLGACLTVAAGPRAILNRVVLSNRILVWLGLISYPLYLWHWPLFSFAAIVQTPTPRGLRISIVALSIALAWLTYQFIELPIRYRKSHHVVASLLTAMACLGLFSYSMYFERPHWFGLSYNSEKQGDVGLTALSQYLGTHFYPCAGFPELNAQTFFCLQSRNDRPIRLVIVGDSHAYHLLPGIAEAMPEINVASMGGVDAMNEIRMPTIETSGFKEIYEYVLNQTSITSVIVSENWQNRLGKIPEGKSLEDALRPTAIALRAGGKRVFFADDVPLFSFPPERCKYARWLGPQILCEENRKSLDMIYETWLPSLLAVAKTIDAVKILDFEKAFCDDQFCHMEKDGIVLYANWGHLNIQGSRLLGKSIVAEHPELLD